MKLKSIEQEYGKNGPDVYLEQNGNMVTICIKDIDGHILHAGNIAISDGQIVFYHGCNTTPLADINKKGNIFPV